jgi:nucleoside-diphosphate-sugar epimerase
MTTSGKPVEPLQTAWTLEHDLDQILNQGQQFWPLLRGAKIFLTGGTGFIGCWLLEAIRHANRRLGLEVSVTVLTRNPAAFVKKASHLAEWHDFNFIAGDIHTFEFPRANFDYLIHAATDASAHLNEVDPRRMFDTVVEGTHRVLDFAVEQRIPGVLFLSSGAVYGQQPWEMERVDEDWLGAPNCNDPRAAYAEGKRAAEMLCAIYSKQFGLKISVARIFALLGPYLPLGTHFAAGNFIRDAMQRKPVVISGDGSPCRSYLYASDLVVWLLTLMTRDQSAKPYNVGSSESTSIRGLAAKVASVLGNGEFKVMGIKDPGWNPGRYVPDTARIESDFGVRRTVSLEESILRTALWNGWEGK